MPKAESGGRRTPVRIAVAVGLAAVLFGAYETVMAFVRAHVDARIRESVGRPLPDFTLPLADGGEFSSDSVHGAKVVLNVFRSLCSSCDAEAAAIRQLAQELPPQTVLLGVMTDRVMGFDPATTTATLERKAFRHPVLMADAEFLDRLHGRDWARVTPVTYLVDSNGRITKALRGRQDLETLRRAVAELR